MLIMVVSFSHGANGTCMLDTKLPGCILCQYTCVSVTVSAVCTGFPTLDDVHALQGSVAVLPALDFVGVHATSDQSLQVAEWYLTSPTTPHCCFQHRHQVQPIAVKFS